MYARAGNAQLLGRGVIHLPDDVAVGAGGVYYRFGLDLKGGPLELVHALNARDFRAIFFEAGESRVVEDYAPCKTGI